MKVPGVTVERMRRYAKLIGANPYIPVVPTAKQLAFIAAPQREKGYGGAAGGGKSIAELVHTLLPVNQRRYNGLILRRTFPDLAQPDAIMDVAKQWLGPTDARWNERDKVFYFPKSGAKIQFGFMEREEHKRRYQSAQFQTISFDEATQFPWSQYSFVRSRARRSRGNVVPPTILAATNPGDIGHQWFYRWFVKNVSPERVFIPALMGDNKHLSEKEYRRMLRDLSPIEIAQLRDGKWITDDSGKPFKAVYWEEKNRYIAGLGRLDVHSRYVFCDTAIKDTKDAAFTVMVVVELLKDYRVRVREVVRRKMQLPEIVRKLEELSARYDYDGKLYDVVIEDKANGPSVFQTIKEGAEEPLFSAVTTWWYQGSKEEKWQQAAVWCWRDCVELPYHTHNVADWLFPLEEELFNVPEHEYKDQADAFTLAVLYLEELIAWGYRDRLLVAQELAERERLGA